MEEIIIELVNYLKKEGLIITNAETLNKLIEKRARSLDKKHLSVSECLEVLEVSKSKFNQLIKDERTLLRKTKEGGKGRGNSATYLAVSVNQEKERINKI